jgi:DNA-binding transcriptional LysR family regulator
MMIMHDTNLAALDLNLLVALRALLAERHVTRAAGSIGLSQPAMSHALSRLRALLDDPLLVRTSDGMQPTARAQAMTVPLERALDELQRLLAAPSPFDPARSARRFRIATSDYVELVLLPRLLGAIWSDAPAVDVSVEALDPRGVEQLAEGRFDVAISVLVHFTGDTSRDEADAEPPPGIRVQKLFSDRFVCVVRDGHPRVKKRLSLDDFLDLPHALVAPRGGGTGVVDLALARLGKKRHVAVEVPHFLVAPHVVAETDLVLTLAERVARKLAPSLGLRQLAPPLELQGFSTWMAWHERQHADPAHAWLRKTIKSVAKSS